MKNQDFTPQEERKLRFAEAGILFALILGIAVFVGVRLNDGGSAAPEPTAVTAVETAAPTDVADAPVDVATAPDTETVVQAEAAPAAEVSPASAPEPVVVTYAMAEQAYFDGDYEGAVDFFERYTADHPDNAWGHYMLGLAAWKAGDAENADAAFAAALALDPRHVKSLVNDARVLLELDRTADADTRVAAALDLDPANVDAHRVLGRVRQAQARVEEAKAAYAEALRLDGNDVWSLNNLGLLLIGQGRYDEALAPLAKAAGLDAGLACVQNNLGTALERTGHYAAAADAYARALDANPDYAKADASRTRVLALNESPETEPVDLVALAESFTVAPATTTEMAAADDGTEPQSPDMEVAAAVESPVPQPEEPAATEPPSEDAASDDGGGR